MQLSISEYNTTQINKEAHHSCCESLFFIFGSVLLVYLMLIDSCTYSTKLLFFTTVMHFIT